MPLSQHQIESTCELRNISRVNHYYRITQGRQPITSSVHLLPGCSFEMCNNMLSSANPPISDDGVSMEMVYADDVDFLEKEK